MSTRPSEIRSCDRCGRKRATRHDRRNLCMDCRASSLRPVAAWMEHGLCRNTVISPWSGLLSSPNWWWPESSDPAETDALEAMNICHDCPVRDLCADYAIAHHEEHGIWGGLMPADRKRARALRRRAA